jgi:hypothetical protein
MHFGGSGMTSGRVSNLCIMMTHRATRVLLCSNFSPSKTFLSLHGSRSEWLLAVPYSVNGPLGKTFRNHERHKIKCDGRTPEDSKRRHPQELPTMAGSMEQVCVCVCVCVCVRVCVCACVRAFVFVRARHARVLLWSLLVKRRRISFH